MQNDRGGQNLINKIISFINEQNTAFSGWGVALFTGIISISTIIVKIIKSNMTSAKGLMDLTDLSTYFNFSQECVHYDIFRNLQTVPVSNLC